MFEGSIFNTYFCSYTLNANVPISVPIIIWCPQHQIIMPIRVPPYIRFPHQSSPLHQICQSECFLTSGVPIIVPCYIRCTHQYAPVSFSGRTRKVEQGANMDGASTTSIHLQCLGQGMHLIVIVCSNC